MTLMLTVQSVALLVQIRSLPELLPAQPAFERDGEQHLVDRLHPALASVLNGRGGRAVIRQGILPSPSPGWIYYLRVLVRHPPLALPLTPADTEARSLFMVSLCKTYWQTILAQAVGMGIGDNHA